MKLSHKLEYFHWNLHLISSKSYNEFYKYWSREFLPFVNIRRPRSSLTDRKLGSTRVNDDSPKSYSSFSWVSLYDESDHLIQMIPRNSGNVELNWKCKSENTRFWEIEWINKSKEKNEISSFRNIDSIGSIGGGEWLLSKEDIFLWATIWKKTARKPQCQLWYRYSVQYRTLEMDEKFYQITRNVNFHKLWIIIKCWLNAATR